MPLTWMTKAHGPLLFVHSNKELDKKWNSQELHWHPQSVASHMDGCGFLPAMPQPQPLAVGISCLSIPTVNPCNLSQVD